MTTADKGNGPIEFVDGTLEDVRRKAQDIVAHTFQNMAPVQVFRQGDRVMVSTALPVKMLIKTLIAESADRNRTADVARRYTNRPFLKDHCNVIADYLRKTLLRGDPYIIPPLTLNALDSAGHAKIYVPKGDTPNNSGYMVLPDEAAIRITDGQHRFHAIKQIAEELGGTDAGDKFLNDGVLVMMTLSDNIAQVHQDFADAGRTKSLPPALLAAYDTRQPANNAAMQISERVPLLKGRVNSTGTSVSKTSPYVFLTSQVLQFVKHSLTGATGAKDGQFNQQAEAAFSNKESLNRWVTSRVAFLNIMSEIIPDWNEISKLSPPDGPDSEDVVQKTKAVKQRQYVPMSGAFLNALGLVSHQVLYGATSEENADKGEAAWMEELRQTLAPLRQVNWAREADIWDGNIVIGRDKIRTQAPAVKGAAENMLALLKDEAQLNEVAAPLAQPEIEPSPDRATFEQLADEWEMATQFVSNISPFLEHPAYRQIISMGEAAVPWLLARLDAGGSPHWFAALFQLTGAEPVPPESRGHIREMTAAWQEWGRRQGYEW